jgi:hypothetical protein
VNNQSLLSAIGGAVFIYVGVLFLYKQILLKPNSEHLSKFPESNDVKRRLNRFLFILFGIGAVVVGSVLLAKQILLIF